MSYQFESVNAIRRREDPVAHVRMSSSERRQYRRNVVDLEVTLNINNESFSAELLDISTGGARLRCSVVPRTGIDIILDLEGYGELPATVVRRLPTALAIEFKLPPLQQAEFSERLDRLIKAHA